MMKAVVYTKYGTPDVLKDEEVKKPVPKDNQVLVKVKASSIEISDYLRFVKSADTGKMPISMKLIDAFGFRVIYRTPGADVAGVVEQIGKDVQKYKVGDEVFGTMAAGTYVWVA